MIEKTTITKHAQKPGILLGLSFVIFNLMFYYLNLISTNASFIGVTPYLLMIGVIMYSIKSYRDNVNNGLISLTTAVKIGIIVSAIGAIVYGIYYTIFVTLIEPDFITITLDATKEQLKITKPNLKGNELETALSIAKLIMKPILTVPITLISYSIVGTIFGTIIGLFLRKEE